VAQLRIELFGAFRVSLDGQPVHFAYDKLRALLAYLVMERARPVAREKLAALLWPERSTTAAQTSLRQALATLHRTLEKSVKGYETERPFLSISRDAVQLNPQGDFQIDVVEFQALLADCSAHRHRHPVTCPACHRARRQACALYQGDFLESLYLPDNESFETWSTLLRESLRVQALDVFQAAGEYALWRGDTDQARADAARIVAMDTLDEEGYALMMRSLAAGGQTGQAMSCYLRLQEVLSEEVGAEPSAPVHELYEKIKSGAYPARAATRSGAIPSAITPLIGRSVEIAELNAWLNDPTRRLITITGLGGAGKTRLAMAVAAEQQTAFRDGVVFISLASTSDPERLMPAIAGAVGHEPIGGRRASVSLADDLSGKDMLLVLDRFEHLLPARQQVYRLLERCPGLVLLVTSRQRLGVPGEWVFNLGGLPVPPASNDAQAGAYSAVAYSAVELFEAAASQSCPGFRLGETNRPSVVEICRLVGGLPLALVLVASWVRLLPCHDIAAELRRGLDIVAAREPLPGDVPASLRVVLDQSWASLSDAERRGLRALSVFHGGFDRTAAQAIAGIDLGVLTGLVDRSLVQVSSEGRYDCHDLVRQYAAEQLQSAGEVDTVAASHFSFYVREAEIYQARFAGMTDLSAFLWFAREQGNLQAALDWSGGAGERADPPARDRLAQLISSKGHGGGNRL
jgi:predicted ATPase/DNA-binding SARP family transcriptional activator